MKVKGFKKLIVLSTLVITSFSFTSCNRGYGCPTNFSIDATVVTAVVTAVKTAATFIIK